MALAPSPERVRLACADWQALPPEPWKNGGGVTRTLAMDTRAGAARWRVSIADIERDGPYSRFPGYDRVSVVLSGQGVALQGAGAGLDLLPGVPTAFAGDIAFQSRLLGGPVQVLNLFVLRGAAQVTVSCAGWEQAALIVGSLPIDPAWVQAFGMRVDVGAGLEAVLLDVRVAALPAVRPVYASLPAGAADID